MGIRNILFLFKIVSYKKQISFVLKWAKLTRSYLLRELCRNNSLGFKFLEKRKKKEKEYRFMDRSICYSDIINTYCEGKWKERNRGIFYLPEIANIAESNFAFHNKTRRSSLSVATYCNNARTDLASMMKCIMQLKYQIYKYTNIQRVFPLRIKLTKQSYSRNCRRVFLSCLYLV